MSNSLQFNHFNHFCKTPCPRGVRYDFTSDDHRRLHARHPPRGVRLSRGRNDSGECTTSRYRGQPGSLQRSLLRKSSSRPNLGRTPLRDQLPSQNVHTTLPHSCVAQVAVRSPSHTDLILERPPSLSLAPLASLLSVFSPRPSPLPARDARLTLRLLLRYREPPQLSAPCVSRLDLTMGRGRRARKTNPEEEKATTTVSTKCPDCLSTYDAHEQSAGIKQSSRRDEARATVGANV